MEMDYTFFGVGGLHQLSVEVMKELCRRFGSDKANNVFLTSVDCHRKYGDKFIHMMGLELEIECSIKPSKEDILFLSAITLSYFDVTKAKARLDSVLKKTTKNGENKNG